MTDHDPRVRCLDCRHYRDHGCGNHKRAQLQRQDVSRAMAALPQWCAGFALAVPPKQAHNARNPG